MIPRVVLIFSLAVAQVAAGGEPTPAPAAHSTGHSLVVYRVEDTGGYIALVDSRAFATLEGLKRYIEKLPAGDRVSWMWFGDSSPANSFLHGFKEIRALCEEKGIKFVQLIE
jgi:hypothetical protein